MKKPIYRLMVPDELAELICGMHPYLKMKIKTSLKMILANPDEGKALKDELAGLRSFRVSKFRIIYRMQKNIIEIVAIGPRERIYEETLLLLKKEKQ